MAAGQIGLTELTLGVPSPAASLQIGRYALGAAASRTVLRGDAVQPADAVRLGVTDQIVPGDELLDRAVTIVASMTVGDRHAYALVKRQLHQTVTAPVAEIPHQDLIRTWISPVTRDRLTSHMARLRRGGAAGLLGPP